MPRVNHIKKARKDNPAVKKGEPYYWWEFAFTNRKHYSATHPRPSQLTQSAYYGGIRSLVETIEDYEVNDAEDLGSLKEDVRSGLEEMGSMSQESLDNMPDSLQEADTGQLLQARIDACENGESELDGLEEEFDGAEEFEEEEFDGMDVNENERDAAENEFDKDQAAAKEAHEAEQADAIRDWANGIKDEMVNLVSECEYAG